MIADRERQEREDGYLFQSAWRDFLHFTSIALAEEIAFVAMATGKRGPKNAISLEHKHSDEKGEETQTVRKHSMLN